jgi:hypothetical protein
VTEVGERDREHAALDLAAGHAVADVQEGAMRAAPRVEHLDPALPLDHVEKGVRATRSLQIRRLVEARHPPQPEATAAVADPKSPTLALAAGRRRPAEREPGDDRRTDQP